MNYIFIDKSIDEKDFNKASDYMSIFILEDDVIQAQQMKRLVEEICEKYMLPFDFIEVTSKK